MVPRKPTPLFLVYGGEALDGLVYRIGGDCPPTVDDLMSYEALGMPYDRRAYFKGTGISVFRSPSEAVRIARRYGHGQAVAALDARRRSVVWAQTGKRGHLTLWAPAETLLECVVQCERHE